MPKVLILVDVADEYADPDHEMGLTEEGFLTLIERGVCIGEVLGDHHKMCEVPQIRVHIPIDIEGMVTDRNPSNCYLPSDEEDDDA